MPALTPTDHFGTITWLGRVARDVGPDLIIHGEALSEMPLTFAGYEGESHAGLTRASCSRVMNLHPFGTTIANTRQLSLVCAEEMAEVAQELGLDAMDYAWLGASVVVSGIPDFSHVPPSSRLQADNGTTLVVDLYNRPCLQVSKTIERDRPGHGKGFKPAAKDRRGVVAWVEREGTLRIGDRLRLFVPGQRPWAYAAPMLAEAAE